MYARQNGLKASQLSKWVDGGVTYVGMRRAKTRLCICNLHIIFPDPNDSLLRKMTLHKLYGYQAGLNAGAAEQYSAEILIS